MTNVKDKLSASVKQARSQQQPLEAEATGADAAKADATAETTPVEAPPLPAEKPKSVPKPTPKPAPKAAAKVSPMPVAINKPTEAAEPATSAVKKTSSNDVQPNDVQPSGSALFPARVWPD